MNIPWADFGGLSPAIALAVGAIALLLTEVSLRGERRGYQGVLATAAAVIAAALYVQLAAGPDGAMLHPRRLFGGAAVIDGFSCFAGVVICAGLFLTTISGGAFLRPREAERGEFYALLLLSASGMCLLVQGNELIFIFIALETMSIATYALAAYLRADPRAAEAAFKYFLLGAVASAIFVYGSALCYGAAGHTQLDALASVHAGILLKTGLAFVLAAFAFKVAAVPFHMWVPDVYEGAPTPVTAFMAVAVKTAAFAALLRILVVGFGPDVWQPFLSTLAILTMVCGNLLALTQRSVKRMLAYSSVAHAGYLLVAVVAAGKLRVEAGQALLFYLATYTASAGGAFIAVSLVERIDTEGGQAWDLDRFAGLAQRRPILALGISVLMLSLGGIPPTAGFMGKLLVFRAAIDSGQVVLAIVGTLSSLIGLYYYLRVVVYMYMRPSVVAAHEVTARAPWGEVALLTAAAVALWIGMGPGWLSAAAAAGTLFAGG
jgi:NADH-quinone oxidoreductase subunit N